jgi:energy-coupling factor transporter ATP-binding protein EcfA2
MAEPVLSLQGVRYRYPGGARPALDGIDLELYEGELVLVAGASAGGKSTLLRAANGLVPHFFGGELAGRVLVCGYDTRQAGPARLAAVAGSVFQDPESQVVMNTVRSELALPLENRGWPAAAVARATEESALALGIAELLERPVHTLSGGELQRVALGAALVTAPRLLLLDEPSSQLDPVAADELIWQLRHLNEQWGTTVVVAEQRIERCLAAVDRVVALERGRLACDALPREFLEWASKRAPVLLPPAAAMFARAGLRPLPVGVKQARAMLRARDPVATAGVGQGEAGAGTGPDATQRRRLGSRFMRRGGRRFLRRASEGGPVALELDRVWVEYDDGTGGGLAALRGLSLRVAPGEAVALLGRNGAGKSTLLRVAAGIRRPDRGRVRASGDVALVVQNPADYFLHERACEELPAQLSESGLREVGLGTAAESDPRDLSGGERQRLALAIVLAGRGIGEGAPPAVVALDEPTRGMDREHKLALARRLRSFARRGAAVIVATHEVEFAARVAERCILLGSGQVLADGSVREVLSGGRYFATEVARVLGPGAGVVLPEEGADWLRARLDPEPAGPTAAARTDRRTQLGAPW